ncbi:MAG: hypothetical protein CMK89_01995 [Pseudomonadales bacterium]|nr:hypothetical protein [Pseudomonadales bacterium]
MKDDQDHSPEPNDADVQAWLKQAASSETRAFDPDQSLRRVLSHAKQQTATRDVMGFFMSWFWMLFAGFGASIYGAGQRRHPSRQIRKKRRPKPAADQ